MLKPVLWVVCAALMASCAAGERPTPPTAKDGMLDLRDWDFEAHGSVPVHGEWHFWWEEFVAPELFMEGETPPKPQALYDVPSLWTGMEHPTKPGEVLTGDGFGTFAMKVLMPSRIKQSLGLFDQGGYMTYERYWVGGANPVLSKTAGKPARNEVNTLNGTYVARVVEELPSHEPVLWLVYHASNFEHPRGGFGRSPQLGVFNEMNGKVIGDGLLDALVIGILLIMGLYHIGLFVQRPEDKTSIVFGIACVAIALRSVVILRWVDFLSPGVSAEGNAWQWLTRFEYLGMMVGGSGTFAVIAMLVKAAWYRWTVVAYCLISAIYSVVILVTPPAIFAVLLNAYQGVIFVGGTLAIVHLVLAVYRQDLLARILLMAFGVVFLGIVHDILWSQVTGFYVVSFTFIFFIFAKAYVLSLRFAQAHRTAERLTEHLQEEVDAQTAMLRETSERELQKSHNLLIQSEKLAALGQMVASIGHELANPTNLASMSVQIQADKVDELEKKTLDLFDGIEDEDALEVMRGFEADFGELRATQSTMVLATDSLTDLTLALRTQSRREDKPDPDVQLNDVVHECAVLAGGHIKQFQVSESLCEDLPTLTGFRSRIGQVITNLLSNAGDALQEKADAAEERGERFEGQIRIETMADTRDGIEGVKLITADNGPGVPQAIREQIFEEFFTTKPAGVGTGLGLSMCLSIVREHGGILEVSDDSLLGGAHFELWLPCAPPDDNA